MKYKYDTYVRSYEIAQNWEMKLSFLAKTLQEAAFMHSEHAGHDLSTVIKSGYAWIVYTFLMEIHRFPKYKEHITVTTWIRRSKKFRAFREFEVHCGEEKLASIGGIGLFVNIHTKEVHYATHDALNDLDPETDPALAADQYKWRVKSRIDSDVDIDITTRFSDIDMLGHVNNSEYFGFLETAIFKQFGDHAAIKNVKLQYIKAIEKTVGSIKCGFQKKPDAGYLFKIHDTDAVFAQGEVLFDVRK